MRTRLAAITLLVVLVSGYVGWLFRPLPKTAANHSPRLAANGQPATFASNVQPLFAQYCYNCHGERKKGGLDLRPYRNQEVVLRDRRVFEKVLHNIEAGSMPPENKPQPTPAERALLTGWLNDRLFYCDCDNPDPGRVTLHRLNRTEYNNTIRDLVGVEFHPADDFPLDDVGYGFDNIGDVLSLSPMLLEKYFRAAEKILDAAIVTGPLPAPSKLYHVADLQGGTLNKSVSRELSSEGEIWVEQESPKEGDYLVRVRAFGEQSSKEPIRMGLTVGAQPTKAFEVTARKASSPQLCELSVHVSKPTSRVALTLLNDDPHPNDREAGEGERKLHVAAIEITGPIETNLPALPESHRRIFKTVLTDQGKAARRESARSILEQFTRRAYRRPVAHAEVDRLLRFYDSAIQEGENFERSVQLALEAVLVSPHFLFRGEVASFPNDPNAITALDDYALASRLSYFLWSTMPDEELFKLAAAGRLRQDLPAQVARMLASSRSHALIENFAAQWLQLRNLDLVAPDQTDFPAFDAELRAAMRTETEMCFEHVMRQDRSVLEFLDADYTFVNERLARHYGLTGVTGSEFRQVSLRGTGRGGLLTQASILTITSNPTRTSPVKRGKWVLENILGTPPPPPPPVVPELPDSKAARLTGTLRQRMEQHRADPLCSSCHSRMDPIGFGFENFDAIGAWRPRDGDLPIDPAGKLVTGESFQGPEDLKRILFASKRQEYLQCLTRKMLTYALGRGLEYYDQCAVDRIVEALNRNNCRFSTLVLEIAQSVPFQYHRGDQAPNQNGTRVTDSGVEPSQTSRLAAR